VHLNLQDNCIPYTQDQEWTSKLGLKEIKGWHPWKVDDAVAGYATEYDENFTFTTVKGAGHLCPLTQPLRSFAMMDRFVQGKPL
jgi:carboxypeptidase C (cathepsin A)